MRRILCFMAVVASFASCESGTYQVKIDSRRQLNPYDSTFDYHIERLTLSTQMRETFYLAHMADIDHPIDSVRTGFLGKVAFDGNVAREGAYCLFTRNHANNDEIRMILWFWMNENWSHGSYGGGYQLGSNYMNYKAIADIDSASVVVEGCFEGAPHGTAYLIDCNAKTVDSLTSDNGSFAFRNNIDATKPYLVKYNVFNSYNNTTDDEKVTLMPKYKLKNGKEFNFKQKKYYWLPPVVKCQPLTDSTVRYVIDGRTFHDDKEIYLLTKGDKRYSADNPPTKDDAEAVCKVVDGKFHFEGVAPVRGVQLYGKKYYRYIWFDYDSRPFK